MPRHCNRNVVRQQQCYRPSSPRHCSNTTTTQYPSTSTQQHSARSQSTSTSRTTTPSTGRTINADKINFGGDDNYYIPKGETIQMNIMINGKPGKASVTNKGSFMSIKRIRVGDNYAYELSNGRERQRVASTDSPFAQQRKIQADQFKKAQEPPRPSQKSSTEETFNLLKNITKKQILEENPTMLETQAEKQAKEETLEAFREALTPTDDSKTPKKKGSFKVLE